MVFELLLKSQIVVFFVVEDVLLPLGLAVLGWDRIRAGNIVL